MTKDETTAALGVVQWHLERAKEGLRAVVDGAAYSATSHAAFMALASVNDAWAQTTSAQAHNDATKEKA